MLQPNQSYRLTPQELERLASLIKSDRAYIVRTLQRFGVWEPDAEDAAQRVFLLFASKLRSVAPGCERAFIRGCAVRVASAWRRSQARRRLDFIELNELPSGSTLPDELLERQQARRVFESRLARVRKLYRDVFMLHELEELTVDQIAARLGVPSGTVSSRLRSARQELSRRSAAAEAE